LQLSKGKSKDTLYEPRERNDQEKRTGEGDIPEGYVSERLAGWQYYKYDSPPVEKKGKRQEDRNRRNSYY